jgi:uncharacterized repeat protein (TIGR01451 family)
VTGWSSASGRPASIRPRKFRPVLEALEDRLVPTTFNVTSLADSNVAGSGSLRAAISASNATPGPNTINILTPGPYALTLNGTATDNSAGELAILNNDVTILNQSGGTVTIDAGGLTTPERVFDISPTGGTINVTLTGVTIQGGNTTANGGGILVNGSSNLTLNNDIVQNNTAGNGGGINDFGGAGTLTVTNSTVSGNSASGIAGGGGITLGGNGTLIMNNSLIANNSSRGTGPGGGIADFSFGDVFILGSEFLDNTAAGDGGGFFNTGAARLQFTASTFSNNQAGGNGGGIHLETALTAVLTNVTISGNSAGGSGGGGGLFWAAASGHITLQDDTIAFNSATNKGGGVFVASAAGSLDAVNTIIAKNTATGGDPDVFDTVATDLMDGGGNFIGDNTGASTSFPAGAPNVNSSFVGTAGAALDPLLEPLADNGGTVLLPDGSHLLTHQDDPNNGNNGVRNRAPGGLTSLTSDERGFPVASGARDIGAFEFQNFDVAVSTSAPAGTLRAGQPATFTLTVTNNGPNTSRDVTLSATLPEGTTVIGATPRLTRPVVLVNFAVPDLAAGGSASFTLTVVLAAPGPFTAGAEVSTHDDPNLANNTASATVTVLPRAFPATGFADVTGLLDIMLLGPHPHRPHKLLFVRLINGSTTPIQGPLGVGVPGLRRRGPKLVHASGTTAGGQKFVLVPVGGDGIFEPGQSAFVELFFSQPFKVPGLDVLAGAFA